MGHDLMWRLTFTQPFTAFFLRFQMRFHLIETNEAYSARLPCLTMATLNLITQKAARGSIDLSVVKHDVKHIKVVAPELVNKLVTF